MTGPEWIGYGESHANGAGFGMTFFESDLDPRCGYGCHVNNGSGIGDGYGEGYGEGYFGDGFDDGAGYGEGVSAGYGYQSGAGEARK